MNHQFEHERDAVRLSLDLLRHKHLRGYAHWLLPMSPTRRLLEHTSTPKRRSQRPGESGR